MSRSQAGQGLMFVMVMDTVELGRGLGRTGGQAAGGEGTGGVGGQAGWKCVPRPVHRPPSFGSCLGLLFLSENLQRKFLGPPPWEVAPMGPLSSRGHGRCCRPSVGANDLPEAKSGGLVGRKLSLVQTLPLWVPGLLLPSAGGASLSACRGPLASAPLLGDSPWEGLPMSRPRKQLSAGGGGRKSHLGRVGLHGPGEADESLGPAKSLQCSQLEVTCLSPLLGI